MTPVTHPTTTQPAGPSHGPALLYAPAGHLARYAVHSGTGDIDPDRAAINAALRASIAAHGVLEPVTVQVDRDRGLAHLANGNHRVAFAPADMIVPYVVRYVSGLRRANVHAQAWDASNAMDR